MPIQGTANPNQFLRGMTVKQGTIVLTLTGLFFTTTNFVPLSAIPSALFLALLPLIFFSAEPWPSVTKWAIAYYVISLASVLLYYPPSLLEFDFYRYDGNFILSFAPFLFLPLVKWRANIAQVIIA